MVKMSMAKCKHLLQIYHLNYLLIFHSLLSAPVSRADRYIELSVHKQSTKCGKIATRKKKTKNDRENNKRES